MSVFTIYVAVVLGQYFHVFLRTLHSCTNTTDIRNGMDTRIMGEERRETEMEDVWKNDMEMKERVVGRITCTGERTCGGEGGNDGIDKRGKEK